MYGNCKKKMNVVSSSLIHIPKTVSLLQWLHHIAIVNTIHNCLARTGNAVAISNHIIVDLLKRNGFIGDLFLFHR